MGAFTRRGTAGKNRRMKWPRPAIVATLLLALAVTSVIWVSLAKTQPEIAQEHGPMENLQTGCLLLGVILFLAGGRGTADAGVRVTFMGMALFYFTLLLLEFDVRPFKIAALTFLLNGAVRNALLGMLWLALSLAAFKHRAKVLRAGRSWITTSPGVLLIAAGVFWAAGRLAEELHLFAGRHLNTFAEELMENQAAIIMLFAAFEAWRARAGFARGLPGGQEPISARQGGL